MPEQDSWGAGPGDPGGVNERLLFDADGGVAHHPEVLGHEDGHDGNGCGENASAGAGLTTSDRNRHHDGQQKGGHGVQRVHHQHQHPVQPAAQVAGGQTQRHAHRQGHHQRGHYDQQCGAGTEQHPREHIFTTHRSPEPVLPGRRVLTDKINTVRTGLGEPVWRQQGRQYRNENEHRDQDQTGH